MIRMKRITRVAAAFLFCAATAGSTQAADTIRINGSGSALDMLKPMLAAYKKVNKNAEFTMEKPLGSSGALKALGSGMLDLVATSKPLTAEDAAKGCLLREYGKTPLAIVTEKGVKKTDVTTRELEDIYNGKMTAWPDGTKIRIVLRPQGDIDTRIMGSISPDMNTAILAAASRPGMINSVTDPEAYGTVSKTSGAIGATGLTSFIVEKLPLNVLSLNNIRPSARSLADHSYPMAKNIDFVTTAKSSPAAMKFLEFVYSKQGRAIAEKAGVLVTAAR